MTHVRIVGTGIANLASVVAALRRCRVADPGIASRPDEVESADALVLPGVGAFSAGMASIRELGIDRILQDRIRQNRPTLAICLGMQMLFAASDESPGVEGLAVAEGVVGRFSPPPGSTLRVPQLGWNQVTPASPGLVEAGAAYFANSYRVIAPPAGWECAWSDHGGRFVAAIERGAMLACQFHPELSGAWGLALLRRWLAKAGVADISGTADRPPAHLTREASAPC